MQCEKLPAQLAIELGPREHPIPGDEYASVCKQSARVSLATDFFLRPARNLPPENTTMPQRERSA